MPSFAASICLLSLVQASLVALPRARPFPALERLRGPFWALIPAGSVAVVIFGLRAAAGAAQGLTYLALVTVPPLAAVTLAWSGRGARRGLALLVIPLLALAWGDRGGLAGEAAALILTALACVTLGTLLAALAPPRWLKLGIVAMAVVDTWLVVSDLLQAPNDVLNAAAPAAGLPQLQEAAFGRGVMGFGDLFIAAVLGAVLAESWTRQRRAALVALALALAFNLLFFAVRELPATVPIALTLIATEAWERRRGRRQSRRLHPRAGRVSRRTPRPS